MPMQAAGACNRPISLQPFGQVPCRAVCGVAALVDSRAIHCAPRLASHPSRVLVRLQKDLEQALIPIDLIPDFIPVLGCVDDLLLLPGMIWLAIRLIPAPVLQQCRDQADLWIKTSGGKPTSRIGAVLVVAIWVGAGLALWHWLAA